jgi:hypothetical protein
VYPKRRRTRCQASPAVDEIRSLAAALPTQPFTEGLVSRIGCREYAGTGLACPRPRAPGGAPKSLLPCAVSQLHPAPATGSHRENQCRRSRRAGWRNLRCRTLAPRNLRAARIGSQKGLSQCPRPWLLAAPGRPFASPWAWSVSDRSGHRPPLARRRGLSESQAGNSKKTSCRLQPITPPANAADPNSGLARNRHALKCGMSPGIATFDPPGKHLCANHTPTRIDSRRHFCLSITPGFLQQNPFHAILCGHLRPALFRSVIAWVLLRAAAAKPKVSVMSGFENLRQADCGMGRYSRVAVPCVAGPTPLISLKLDVAVRSRCSKALVVVCRALMSRV